MGGAHRNRNRQGRAVPGNALGANAPAVQLDELLYEREPDAAAFMGAATGGFDPMKPLEQMRHFVRWDADSGIVDLEFRDSAIFVLVDFTKPDFDPSFEGEFERIRDKIENDLFPHVAIDEHRLGKLRAVHDELEPGPFGCSAKNASKVGGEAGQIGGFVSRLRSSCFDA